MNTRGRIVIVLLFSVAAFAGVCAFWVPRWFEAAWFLEDIAAGPGPTTWKTLHKPPQVRAIHDRVAGRDVDGDLYIPAEKITGRMIFVPGLVESARTDARVVAFAQTLARAGFLTFVPDLEAFRDLRASPDDIGAIADAAQYLTDAEIDRAPKTRIGIAALSYMSGPVMLAASRAPTNGQTAFVFFIGGYYSIDDVTRFVTTRKYKAIEGGPWLEAPPAPYALWAFLKTNAQGVDDAQDRLIVERIAEQKLSDENADVSVLAGQLKADGKPVYDLIVNRDPEKVEALIGALPARLRDGMEALDPSRQDLSGFTGEALLVHGRDDPFIPAVESEKLAAALGGRAHVYVLEQVSHVEVNGAGSVWDQMDLLFAGRRLLSYRE